MKHLDPRARCSQRSLRVCVVAASFCRSLSELPTKTQKGNAQKRKQPNTHVPRPDPARNHPSRPRPRQTPQTTPKPNANHTHTTHHTTTTPHHQTHKHKNQTKNTKRGQGGIEEMRRKEKRRGEGKKRRRKEKGENTKRGQKGIEPPTSSTARSGRALTYPLPRRDGAPAAVGTQPSTVHAVYVCRARRCLVIGYCIL